MRMSSTTEPKNACELETPLHSPSGIPRWLRTPTHFFDGGEPASAVEPRLNPCETSGIASGEMAYCLSAPTAPLCFWRLFATFFAVIVMALFSSQASLESPPLLFSARSTLPSVKQATQTARFSLSNDHARHRTSLCRCSASTPIILSSL